MAIEFPKFEIQQPSDTKKKPFQITGKKGAKKVENAATFLTETETKSSGKEKGTPVVAKSTEKLAPMTLQQWNGLTRLAGLMFPIEASKTTLKLQVPETKFYYSIHIGPNLPRFTYLPRSLEII
jgi:hypothetical protein